MTIKVLAEKSGVESASLSRIEKGKVKPYLSTLGKIAAALEIPVEELITEQNQVEVPRYKLRPADKAELLASIAESDREDAQGIVITLEEVEEMVSRMIAEKLATQKASA